MRAVYLYSVLKDASVWRFIMAGFAFEKREKRIAMHNPLFRKL